LYDQRSDGEDTTDVHKDLEKLALNDSRSEMEAIYILLHIGDSEALERALTLSSDLK